MGSSMTTAEESNTEDSTEMATPTKDALEELRGAIAKLDNPKTAASGCDQVCQTLQKCLKIEDGQEAALHLVEQALLKYGVELKNPRGSKSNSAAARLLEMVFPLMWVETPAVREVALRVVKMIPTDPRPDCWSKLKTDTHTQYCKALLNMVVTMQKDWPTLWMETVKFFGTDLHTGAHLINQLLGVLEKAYKNPDVDWTRLQAFECWKALIDSFKEISLNPKRIALILIPLRATNHRTEELTRAKYDTFMHLIKSLPKTQDMYDTLKAFLTFCFYASGDTLLPLRSYARLQPLCFEALETAVTRACESKCVAKLTKQLVMAFSQCLQLTDIDEERIKKAWAMLLENIAETRGSDTNRELIREMLHMLDDVATASAGMNRSPPMSPDSSASMSSMATNFSQNSCLPQEEFGSLLTDLLHELIVGPSALTSSQLASVSLYVGNDVMTGTPALMAVQWLLSPGILLSSGCTEKYKTMIKHLVNTSVECLGGPLSFIPKVLKMATKVASAHSDSAAVIESLTLTWCSMAEVLVRWVNAGGELNQGDAANHDFSCLYSVVHFPVTHLYTNTISLIRVWSQLYQKSSPQVALVSTTGTNEFCDQISTRLITAVKEECPKNRDALFAAVVACGEAMIRAHKATHSKWGHEQDKVVTLLSEVTANASGNTSDELIVAISRCVAQFEVPVPLCSAAAEVVTKLAPVLLLLLKYPSPSQHLAQQIVSAFAALKAIVEKHWQFPSTAPEDVKTAVCSVVTCAQSHSCRNIKTSGNALASLMNGLGPDDSSSFDAPPQVIGSILHPPKESVGSKTTVTPKTTATAFSPKLKTTPTSFSPKLKTTPTSFSPLNKSPLETPNRRNKRKLDEAMEQFVVIKRPTPVKMVLTEHQKEVLRRKADIPALYQDLSQDTQNASQDCVILPSSPANPPKRGRFEPDEEAVMDFDDIVPFKNAGKDLDSSVSILEEEKLRKVHGTIEIDDNATMQSVSDANDDILTCSQDSDMAVRLEDEPVSAVQEKATVTPNRRKSIVPVRKEPTVTRSRKVNEALVTRSGKLLKSRQSLGNHDFKSPPKVKRQRKSLPSGNVAQGRSESESSEDNAPAEPRSPTKALARGRGSRVTPKAPPKAAESKVPETEASKSALETSKSSDETLSAASPSTESTESSVISSDASASTDPASKAFTSPPPSAIRERSRRKTTPTRKALLLFQEHNNVDRISQAVSAKNTKASKVEQPKPTGRTLRRTRSKNSFDENDPKPTETEVADDGSKTTVSPVKATTGSPLKAAEPVVVIEKLDCIPEIEQPAPEPTEIAESDSEPQTQAETSIAEPEPEEAPASSEASKPEEVEHLKESETREAEIPPPEEVIPESQDIIESSQGPEDSISITTPRCSESPKKDDTPASAKWTLRVSDTFTPQTSPAPSTPKAAVEEKVPRRIVDENDERSDSMPSWMHAKKIVSPGKPRLVVKRISPADLVKVSQPASEEGSGSPPPKPNESTPTSSPVQSKWMRSESATPTGRSPGSFAMRTGRAAHLLGLGQAAAARSGEEIRTTLSPSHKEEAAPATSAQTTPAVPEAVAPAPATLNSANGMSVRATLNGNVIASPRVRKRTRMGLSSRFSDGGLSKEPTTPGSEWIRKTYQPDATPENSILKKPRRTPACLDSDSPPSSKKKRVSFHDPPVSKSLNFFHTTEDEYSGTVHSSGGIDEPLSGKSPALEDKKMVESNPVKWMKQMEEDKRDSLVTVIVEETDQEMEREVRLNVEESSVLRQRNYDDKGDHLRLVASKEDRAKRRDDGDNQADDDDENRWSDGRIRKDEERVDVARWKKMDEGDVDSSSAEEQRLRQEDEEKARKEEEDRIRREAEEKARQEEEESVRKETEERKRLEEEERLRKEAEEKRLEEERIRKEAEEKKRIEAERLKKEAEEKRKEQERIQKEAEERKRLEEQERLRKEAEEKRIEQERIKKEAEERKRLEEQERLREEAEEKRIEQERIKKEAEERKRLEEQERLRKEAEEKRKEQERIEREAEERKRLEEEERLRKEAEEKRIEQERVEKEAKEKKRIEAERLKKEAEEKRKEKEMLEKEAKEKKRIEAERRKKEAEEKRKEQERIEKEAKEKKRIEAERLKKEAEEKRKEQERLEKEAKEKKRIEAERLKKEAEEKRIEQERIQREEEERKRLEEQEQLRKEAEEKRLEEERLLKEAEEKKRVEADRLKKEAEEKKLAEDAERLKEEQERIRSGEENSQKEEKSQVTGRKVRGRAKKRNEDELRRKREEERKRQAEELEKSDAEWSRKEEIRLGVLPETGLSSSESEETPSSGRVSRGPRVDSDLSQIAAFSQGDASVTHPVLFPSPGAVYPSLVGCEEPVDEIIESLTGGAWRRNLLRKFTDANLTTIGHLAALTEEQVNRYAIRPPRKDTLVKALERYERECGKFAKPAPIPVPTTPGRDSEDDLPLSSLVAANEVVPQKPADPVSAIPTSALLKELTSRIGVNGILKQLYESSEADVLDAVESFPGVKKLLPKTPFEDLVEECSARISNINEVAACNGKLVDLVSNAVAKEAILKRTASVLVSQTNGKEILETLFKSVLNHL